MEENDDLAWEVELDRLDLEIARVERLLTCIKPMDNANWVTPTLAGPMPERLLPRALEIHERQTSVLTQILRALHQTQRQRRFADRAGHEGKPAPRYVDVTA